MPHADTEGQLVEPLAIGLFAELGWTVVLSVGAVEFRAAATDPNS